MSVLENRVSHQKSSNLLHETSKVYSIHHVGQSVSERVQRAWITGLKDEPKIGLWWADQDRAGIAFRTHPPKLLNNSV